MSVPGLHVCEACGDYWIPAASVRRPSTVCGACRWVYCKQCGEIFKRTRQAVLNEGHGQYCSRDCQHESMVKLYTCKGCGTEFKRNGRGGRAWTYCSRECAFENYEDWHHNALGWSESVWREVDVLRKWGRRGRYQMRLRVVPCARCGDDLQQRTLNHVHCKPCAVELGRERARALSREMYEPQSGQVECEECGRTVDVDCRANTRRFCSETCSARFHNRNNNARRRAVDAGEDVSMDYLYRRDGGRCQLCGGGVSRKKRWPHPESPSMDHIVPITRGGTHERANVQLAHFACNSRKGNRSAGSQLLLVG